MTLNYEADNKLQFLSPVLDDHAEWFTSVLRYVFYSELASKDEEIQPPDTFKRWLEESEKDDFITAHTIAPISRTHDDLHQAAAAVMKAAGAGNRPDLKLFSSFTYLYEGFVTQLRRLEHDVAQSDNGFDPASGLRNSKALVQDIERELERRARRGKPFSMAIARVDGHERLRKAVSEDRKLEIIAQLGEVIRNCIRSFDDAYRSGDFEFVMSLKHADMTGGTSAVARIKNALASDQILIPDEGGQNVPLTMSYCVAEPIPGDTLPELLKNMRADLERYKEDGASLEYFELSPLSRFIKTEAANNGKKN